METSPLPNYEREFIFSAITFELEEKGMSDVAMTNRVIEYVTYRELDGAPEGEVIEINFNEVLGIIKKKRVHIKHFVAFHRKFEKEFHDFDIEEYDRKGGKTDFGTLMRAHILEAVRQELEVSEADIFRLVTGSIKGDIVDTLMREFNQTFHHLMTHFAYRYDDARAEAKALITKMGDK